MSEELKHAKIKTFTPQEDGKVIVETKSYHEQLHGYKQEILQHVRTSKQTLLSDLISCLEPITGQLTNEITITITTDDYHHPRQITKTYTVKKETYKTR